MRARSSPAFAIPVLLALVLLSAPWPARAETKLQHSVALSMEYDDNVLRTPSDTEQDFLARLLYAFDLVYLPQAAHRLELRYLLGGKKYFSLEREDTLANGLTLGYVNGSFNQTSIGVAANFKLRNTRDSERDYDKLQLDAFYQRNLPLDFAIRAGAGMDRFDYIELDYFDYWVHRYSLSFSRKFSPHVWSGIDYGFGQKRFAFGAFERVGEGGDVILIQRDDRRVDDRYEPQIWLDLRWRARATLSYAYRIKQSNSYGESYSSHLLSGALSVPLFDRVSLNGLAIYQWRATDDEVTIPHSGGVEDEEEHLNVLSAGATIHAHRFLDIEARFGRYWSIEPNDDFRFVKNMFSVGFQFNF